MNRMNSTQTGDVLSGLSPQDEIWLVGIGGCGMSALAHLLVDLGHRVCGSDSAESPFLQPLRERGVPIVVGHSAPAFRETKPALAIYTPAVSADNPELLAAEQLQVPICRRSSALAALMQRRAGVCVTGMHGKSTTSAMLAFALERLGADPGYAVGAGIPQLGRHARFTAGAGDRGFFVAETDESDGSLLEFEPRHAIVLNVDEEHLEYFENLERVCEAFRRFGSRVTGRLVYCADDPRLSKLFAGSAHAVSYGFNPSATYRLELESDEKVDARGGAPGTRFRIFRRGDCVGSFQTRLLGAASASNAAAVAALLMEEGFHAVDVASAIAEFTGAGRRQEQIFQGGGIRVYEDYGHHPEEIEVTLEALTRLRGKRLLVAFQPHKYTRTRFLLSRFAGSFHAADKVWIADVYPAGEAEIPGVNGRTLAEAVTASGQPARFVSDLGRLADEVAAEARVGDVALFLGAGDITLAARTFAQKLEAELMARKEELLTELKHALSDACVVRMDEPMAKRTTLRVGGPADLYVEPDSEQALSETLKFCERHQMPFRIIGRGSNLLVRDGGFRGAAICLKQPAFSEISVVGTEVRCGAGARLKKVAQVAKQHGLGGLEFLEGIPGSVGGALRMNAGAMGGATFDSLSSVRYMSHDGVVHVAPASGIEFGYRSCPLFRDHIALGAVFDCVRSERSAIQEKMDACSQKRWGSQPAAPSAGCMFKNPDAIPAGKLVDELGLKGFRIGGAMVSDVHGNFVVNAGGAKAGDVLELIEAVKRRAFEERGIELRTEVEIIGEDEA
jgi:UDP-N-acetylmuramate--alanine ligase